MKKTRKKINKSSPFENLINDFQEDAEMQAFIDEFDLPFGIFEQLMKDLEALKRVVDVQKKKRVRVRKPSKKTP